MSFNPLALVFLPHHNSSPALAESLGNLTPMNLYLIPILRGMPPLLRSVDEPSLCPYTPEGAVGLPRTKTASSSTVDSQSAPNTRHTPSAMIANWTSRARKLERCFLTNSPATDPSYLGVHESRSTLCD